MVSAAKFILAVGIMIGLCFSAYAIKCYECDSVITPKCGIKFEEDDTLLADCSRYGPRYISSYAGLRNATGCIKRTIESVGQPHVIRRCFFGDASNIQSACQPDPNLPFVRQLGCDVCSKDECNSSSSLAPIAGAILIFFGLARLLS